MKALKEVTKIDTGAFTVGDCIYFKDRWELNYRSGLIKIVTEDDIVIACIHVNGNLDDTFVVSVNDLVDGNVKLKCSVMGEEL